MNPQAATSYEPFAVGGNHRDHWHVRGQREVLQTFDHASDPGLLLRQVLLGRHLLQVVDDHKRRPTDRPTNLVPSPSEMVATDVDALFDRCRCSRWPYPCDHMDGLGPADRAGQPLSQTTDPDEAFHRLANPPETEGLRRQRSPQLRVR